MLVIIGVLMTSMVREMRSMETTKRMKEMILLGVSRLMITCASFCDHVTGGE